MNGTISGNLTIGYTLSVSPTTIADTGTVAVTAGNAIDGSAATAWSVLNSGVVQAPTSGIAFAGTGTVDNQPGGTISGGHGAILMHSGYVTNAGVLSGTASSIIRFDQNGATVTNAGSGRIIGGSIGVNMQAGTVLNAGSITGATIEAISMRGGYLSNAAQGVISAGNNGVAFLGSGTVVNAGTLQATAQYGDALQFFHGYTDRLVIYPGAVFIGAVDGAGIPGVITGAVLELASGSSVGTLDGLGSQFTNVGSISVDPGAAWEVSGASTLGVVLLAGAGVTLAAGSTLNSGSAATGALVFAARGGRLSNHGTIDAAQQTGVQLHGGTVVNAADALIAGGKYGVYIYGGAGSVVNSGGIVGTTAFGAFLQGGGALTNSASGSIMGIGGILMGGSIAGTVVNYGSIVATGARAAGVVLGFGGTVTNAASATITGGYGVLVETRGTVVNAGRIATTGTGVTGVFLDAGGYVGNAAAASITGYIAGIALAGPGTVANGGRIAATGTAGYGVGLAASGTVTNAAGASITGDVGVSLDAGGTLANAGTIIGSGGTAAVLSGTGDNLLVLEPGFGFSGLVSGGASAANTLELASAAMRGTVTGLGTQFTNFGSIAFDAGARWLIAGNSSALTGTISGFVRGDTIELTGLTVTGSSFSGSILTIDDTVGFTTLDLPGGFTAATSFYVTPNSGGTAVTVAPCFAAGTRLLTASGEVAVEALAPGDLVATRSGRLRRVRWIGHRRVELARHPRPQDVDPVRVRADAFAPGVPHRDLWLSPDHALFVDGVLIPVRHLCNGATVRQERCAAVVYYHVELDTHDIVLAEGMPAESYLDTGNRGAFENGDGTTPAHAEFALRVWQNRGRARAASPGRSRVRM